MLKIWMENLNRLKFQVKVADTILRFILYLFQQKVRDSFNQYFLAYFFPRSGFANVYFHNGRSCENLVSEIREKNFCWY